MSAGPQTLSKTVERVYAIGDVHGRADLLAPLLREIERTAPDDGRAAIVFLGDLVDRGPDSRGVLDLVIGALQRFPGSKLCLGNHDDWLRRCLAGDPTMADDLELWLGQGGLETLQSYAAPATPLSDIRRGILAETPRHASLLEEAAQLVRWRDLVFVHAGVDPAIALVDQPREASLWIRSVFLRYVGPLEAAVVHGHTPQSPPRPHVTENRISIDTGAFFSHVLTAAVFDAASSTLQFWTARRDGTVRRVVPIGVDRGMGTLLDPIGDDAENARPQLFRWP
ncbi:metallophosphoesterase [Aureimonas sp. AU12]|uniref:metallophosphoesterase n=1 Tax=Aureimonas sp. AU12 TaxID=1638161 RepID=UPI000784774A|nr:metallophosphoesterase [Aureimonas sp. AU12]